MRAMVLTETGPVDRPSGPLEMRELERPEPGPGDVLVRVLACGVCHTELDEIEGRTAPPSLPVVPGHEIVGVIEAVGADVEERTAGERVGVGWLYDSCGTCAYCRAGLENLCDDFVATGRDVNGGYAEYVVVPASSAFPVPDSLSDSVAAPLLCAGAVGYRSLRLADLHDRDTLGFAGFGASAHIVLQMARHEYPDVRIYVFSRSEEKRQFARSLGAEWAGEPGSSPPEQLDAVIDTTPVWRPVEQGLRFLAPAGRLVINAIRKVDDDKTALTDIEYDRHLWLEKRLLTVANVTRADIREALKVAGEAGIRPTVETKDLSEANEVLRTLGDREGAQVLRIST